MDDRELDERMVESGGSEHDSGDVEVTHPVRCLRQLLDLSVDAVISADEEHRMTLFNRGAQRMFGYEESEALGSPVSMLMPERFRATHEGHLRELAERPDGSRMMGQRGQIAGLRKSGEEFPAEASISKVTVEGRPVFSVVLRDVSTSAESEGKILETEARWHRLADELPILFSLVDADERYVFVDRTYEEFFGRPRARIDGRTVEEILGESVYREVRPYVQAALAGSRQRFQVLVDRKDGRRRVMDVMYVPRRIEGRVAGFFVAAVDITARARVEERLRQRGEAIRSLHRIGSHPSLTLGEKIEALLALGCEQFDLELGVLARVAEDSWIVRRVQPASASIAPGDVFPLAGTLCERAVAGSGPVAYRASPDGERPEHYPAYPDEPLGAYLGASVGMAGQTYGVLSFTSVRPGRGGFGPFDRDLIRLMAYWLGSEIEREQVFRGQAFLATAGRVLAASLDRVEILERLVDLAVPILGEGCIVYALEPDGTVTRVHGGHVDPELDDVLAALAPGVLEVGSEPHPVFAALRKGEAIQECWKSREHPQRCLADDGWEGLSRDACASLLAVPVRAGRKVLGAIAFFASEPERYTDIDVATASELAARCASALENASLLEDAREAVRARDDVLSFVSHDLGSPLSSISMSIEYVMGLWGEDRGAEKGRTYLEGMKEAAERMERLIDDLLEVQNLEDESPSGGPEVEAGALLEAASREMLPRFEAGSLDFEITAATDTSVRGDPQRLLRVLVNLLDNAIKFTKPGGRIEVGATREGEGEVRFFVSDTGTGIPEERLARIFDRYAHAADQRRGGAGLGLTIVKKTVELSGGRVWVESEPGSGSTFHFTLPEA